jgi:MFS family permease
MAHPTTSTVPAPHLSRRRWQILGLLGIAQLMLILDVTVVAVALPNISADLERGRQALTWVVSGYTLAFGGLLLLGGRAADLFGARRLVVVGLVAFAGASATALGQVAPHEAGLASGIVSTFHEFGAALGAAVVSSIAATSLAGTSSAGFSRGFITAAVVAAMTALVTLAIAPGRQTDRR